MAEPCRLKKLGIQPSNKLTAEHTRGDKDSRPTDRTLFLKSHKVADSVDGVKWKAIRRNSFAIEYEALLRFRRHPSAFSKAFLKVL